MKLNVLDLVEKQAADQIFFRCAWQKGGCTITVRENLPPRLLLNQSPMVLVSRISHHNSITINACKRQSTKGKIEVSGLARQPVTQKLHSDCVKA